MARLRETQFVDGHIYLTGSASSSLDNTTQIIYGTPTDEHLCISSNPDCFVINPSTTSTTGQIVFYLGDKQSSYSSIPNLKVTGLQVNGKTLLDRTYPVGAVYISYSSTSPASLFGGTWVQITGVFPRFANDLNTGGADTHTLTVAQLPAHNHTQAAHNHYTVTRTATRYKADAFASGTLSGYQADGDGTHTRPTTSSATPTINNTGSGSAHNNMPKYQDFYAWRRTE